jgi:ubiquinone/menaquinone biosynthesis C-methylase UbiE
LTTESESIKGVLISFTYKDHYNEVASHYDYSRLDARESFDFTVNFITGNLEKNVTKIVDIGCGTGRYGCAFSERGFTVCGIDFSFEQIQIAKKLINAIQADCCSLPFEKCSFDAAIMIMMLHQLTSEQRKLTFLELKRILNPHSTIIIKTCSHKDIRNRFSSLYFPKALEYDLHRYPPIDEIREEVGNYSEFNFFEANIKTKIQKEHLIDKFLKRGASNIGMLSQTELSLGIDQILEQYRDDSEIEMIANNTFVIIRL